MPAHPNTRGGQAPALRAEKSPTGGIETRRSLLPEEAIPGGLSRDVERFMKHPHLIFFLLFLEEAFHLHRQLRI